MIRRRGSADAFVDGLQTTFRGSAALATGGFLVALLVVGGRLSAGRARRLGDA